MVNTRRDSFGFIAFWSDRTVKISYRLFYWNDLCRNKKLIYRININIELENTLLITGVNHDPINSSQSNESEPRIKRPARAL